MKAILLFIGSVIIWSGVAQAQDEISEVGSFDIYFNSGLKNEFVSHRQCEQHARERALYNYQLFLEYQRIVGILNEILDNDPGAGDCGGWGGGALWKPVRDNGGPPVFLLPVSYCDGSGGSLISNVRIVSKATGEAVTSTAFRHCNRENGGRLHWNVNTPASELAKNGPILVLYDFKGVQECREVPDANKRYD